MWWLASVPDENASVIRRAGEDVIIDRADRQAVHSIDMQENVQSFPPEGTTIIQILRICVNKGKTALTLVSQKTISIKAVRESAYTHLSTSWRITCSSFPIEQQTSFNVKECNLKVEMQN